MEGSAWGAERGRTRRGRRRLTLAAMGFVVVCGVLAIGVPAWAHHPVLSGETVCSDGTHVITWSIGNSETDKVMTIASASASDGTHIFAVTGYSGTVGPSGSTSATTTVAGGVAGTVTLTVTGTWPDGVTATRQTSVALIESCGPSATSTTQTTSTTISAETSTLPVSTTTITDAGWTSTTNDATTSTSLALEGTTSLAPSTTTSSPSTIVAPSGTLPFTGGSFYGLAAVGVSCVVAGALALIRRRRNTA